MKPNGPRCDDAEAWVAPVATSPASSTNADRTTNARRGRIVFISRAPSDGGGLQRVAELAGLEPRLVRGHLAESAPAGDHGAVGTMDHAARGGGDELPTSGPAVRRGRAGPVGTAGQELGDAGEGGSGSVGLAPSFLNLAGQPVGEVEQPPHHGQGHAEQAAGDQVRELLE